MGVEQQKMEGELIEIERIQRRRAMKLGMPTEAHKIGNGFHFSISFCVFVWPFLNSSPLAGAAKSKQT
jgi:hypothetical protein